VRLAAILAGSLAVATCAIALAVHLALAAEARRWLAFPFTGIPAEPAQAATIFAHNLRALVAVAAMLLIAQSNHRESEDEPGPIARIVQRAGEALLGGAVAANVALFGASMGAYGIRMARAALPHGPLELAAYSLALALYLQGRHRRLPIRHAFAVMAVSVSALALAAVVETFVSV
jgi:hypothetical protein